MLEFNHLKERFLSLNININEHYLNRYLKFVIHVKTVDKKIEYGENHHILPKAKDMFPQLRKISWNQKVISARSHYIAHWMLMKALPGNYGQAMAFDSMCNGSNSIYRDSYRINARAYTQAAILKKKAVSESAKSRPGFWRGKFGNNTPNFGNRWSDEARLKQSKRISGKKIEEIMGKETADRVREENRKRCAGKGNPAFNSVYCVLVGDSTLSTVTLTREEYDRQLTNRSIRYIPKCGPTLKKLKAKFGVINIGGVALLDVSDDSIRYI